MKGCQGEERDSICLLGFLHIFEELRIFLDSKVPVAKWYLFSPLIFLPWLHPLDKKQMTLYDLSQGEVEAHKHVYVFWKRFLRVSWNITYQTSF